MKGGKAIASGAYGCIFTPPLSCSGMGRIPNTVSKLMRESDALNEIREAKLARVAVIDMPPALQNAFILPAVRPCELDPLTSDDLENADNACQNFKKDVRENLNAHLATLRALPQVNGGFAVRKELRKNFTGVTPSLIALLHAVRQLNLRGVVHGDVKSVNIVFNEADNTARLIDWGFTHSLQRVYCNRIWYAEAIPIFMTNAIPTMWVYPLFAKIPDDPTKYTKFVHRQLMQMAKLNENHLSNTDDLFERINLILRRHGLQPIVYALDSKFKTVPGLAPETTSILIAHAVTLMRQWNGSKIRFLQTVDLVYRANMDVYGLLHCFAELVREPRSEARDMVAIAIAPFFMSAEYAARPYNILQIGEVLARVSAQWNAPNLDEWKQWYREQITPELSKAVSPTVFTKLATIMRKTLPTLTADAHLDVDAATHYLDPEDIRVFPYTQFEGGEGKEVPVRFSGLKIVQQVRAGSIRLRQYWVEPESQSRKREEATGTVDPSRSLRGGYAHAYLGMLRL
jgi:hypothetical protein